MKHIESRIQSACVRWYRLTYPQTARLLFAVPNGGKRNAIAAAIFKAEGVVAGVSDLILLLPNQQHHALCIEMKTPEGRQSIAQELFEQEVTMHGYKYAICRSVDDFIETVTEYLKTANNNAMYTVKGTLKRPDGKEASATILCTAATSCVDAIAQATEYGVSEVYAASLSPIKEILSEDGAELFALTAQTSGDKPQRYQMALYADSIDSAMQKAKEQLAQGYEMELVSLKKSSIHAVI